MPNVEILLENVLDHLRLRIDHSDPVCEYRAALVEVLQFASLSPEEFAGIDYMLPVSNWGLRERILQPLVANYSKVLDVSVGQSRPADYLVWEALDLPNVYGNPDLIPDVEHYCIAILLLEGVVSTAVTANWDGLLEAALTELGGSSDLLVRVMVGAEDFRKAGSRIDVVKFHGCAVRARDQEGEYRSKIVARQSQISTWTQQTENNRMRKHLEGLYSDRSSIFLGLSAQDANLHSIFGESVKDLSRAWPASPSPVILGEENLEHHHRHLLRITFGDAAYQNHSGSIADASLIGAYAKPTLLALVLDVLSKKIVQLTAQEVNESLGSGASAELCVHLLGLRDLAARAAEPPGDVHLSGVEIADHQRRYVARLIDAMSFALRIFRTGKVVGKGTGLYESLSPGVIEKDALNPDFPARQFGRFGVALALIAKGAQHGLWSLEYGGTNTAPSGVIRLLREAKTKRLFFVKNGATLTALELSGLVDPDDADSYLIVADEEAPAQTRSPRSRYGRSGRAVAGKFNVASEISETMTTNDLFEAFKLAGGL